MFLSNFHIIDPPYCMSQDDCLNWMASSYVSYQNSQKFSFSEYQKLLKRAGCYSTQIEKRYFFLPDFNSPKIEPGGNQRVFKHGSIGGTNARQEFFQEVTMEVFENLYDQRPVPPFLIHVTCTGYGSPSAAQVIAAKKSPRTIVTHSYHMGCYGAFPAIRMAMGFLSAPVLRNGEAEAVDIVHTELCTLHMAPQDPTPEQMIIQSLFADGVAAYSVTADRPNEPSLEILACEEFLIPQSASSMTWSIGNHGMTMTLAKNVPAMIGSFLRKAFQSWEEHGKRATFAVHPGGPKILDSVKDILELSEKQIRYSREVLRERGNMSSATVPHIWKKVLESDDVFDGEYLISMAFGPGLTLCLSLMQVRK